MSSMPLNTFLLIFVLFFASFISGGAHGNVQVTRKLLGNEAILMDYNEPSANPRHEPRKGSPGGRASFNP
ncbi:hypothetical protein SDJN03_24696, partial [Cucurbita argyrosperma subsp. sororia]